MNGVPRKLRCIPIVDNFRVNRRYNDRQPPGTRTTLYKIVPKTSEWHVATTRNQCGKSSRDSTADDAVSTNNADRHIVKGLWLKPHQIHRSIHCGQFNLTDARTPISDNIATVGGETYPGHPSRRLFHSADIDCVQIHTLISTGDKLIVAIIARPRECIIIRDIYRRTAC